MGLITDGYQALEVPHSWYDSTGTSLKGSLNDLSLKPGTHVKLLRITGLHSLPDADDNRSDHVGRRGQNIYPGYDRSRVILYEGEVRSRDLDEMNAVRTSLRSIFRDRDIEGYMKIGADWHFRARVQSFSSDDEQSWGLERIYPFTRAFTLGLIQSDPRVYWNTAVVATGLASGATSAQTNPGGTDSDPVINVINPGATVILENYAVPGTTGGHAALRFNALPVGSNFTVDFFHRRATMDGLDVSAKLAPDTDWWDDGKPGVVPGSNTLKVSAPDSPGSPSWSYAYYPAMP